jgi:hypothetical protein
MLPGAMSEITFAVTANRGRFAVLSLLMKQAHHPARISIPADIAAKCDALNQFETFDHGIRAMLAVPKSAVLKEEAKAKRKKKRSS